MFNIIASCGLTGHSYADDTQVYISAPAIDEQEASYRLAECVECLSRWMGQNRLKLNVDKTQLIWLGTRQQLAKLTIKQLKLTTSTVEFDAETNDVGVILDSQLYHYEHVGIFCRTTIDKPISLETIPVKISITMGSRRGLSKKRPLLSTKCVPVVVYPQKTNCSFH